jgi:hypothetical protein
MTRKKGKWAQTENKEIAKAENKWFWYNLLKSHVLIRGLLSTYFIYRFN